MIEHMEHWSASDSLTLVNLSEQPTSALKIIVFVLACSILAFCIVEIWKLQSFTAVANTYKDMECSNFLDLAQAQHCE